MFTLGHTFIPEAIHAGGLRYHGASPILSELVRKGLVEAKAYRQTEVFAAAVAFAKSEGILPAPESAHAIKAAIDEANEANARGEARTILFGLSGHGHFDLAAYEEHLRGRMSDCALSDEAIARPLGELKNLPKAG